ncbi:hypothetical protein RIF29_01927 [Crotalaria pallida]|uniref:Uncharacterized protein n=1 Tax=Crotalaria pallida TaxID=3830 RepID=A0AAN9P8B5_CROPI
MMEEEAVTIIGIGIRRKRKRTRSEEKREVEWERMVEEILAEEEIGRVEAEGWVDVAVAVLMLNHFEFKFGIDQWIGSIAIRIRIRMGTVDIPGGDRRSTEIAVVDVGGEGKA